MSGPYHPYVMNGGGGRQRVNEHTGGCSAAIHFIEYERSSTFHLNVLLSCSLNSRPSRGLLMLSPLHIVEGNARTRTATTKRAVWWTVSSRMRDDDAGDDDGAAILEGIRPSRLLFSLSILELRRRAIAGRQRRRTRRSFRLQSFNRFGSMERAPKVCLFACISSSRDRMKFKLHF